MPSSEDFRDEYRLTYDEQRGGPIREGLGLCHLKTARELAAARERAGYTDVKIWRRPKPTRWERVS